MKKTEWRTMNNISLQERVELLALIIGGFVKGCPIGQIVNTLDDHTSHSDREVIMTMKNASDMWEERIKENE